jgi:hypothetical protein
MLQLRARGFAPLTSGAFAPAQREFTHRLDAAKDGRVGVDPHWAREQVLDPFEMSAVILTCPQSYILNSGGNMPVALSMELARAFNDALAHTWMAADPRYHAAIVLPRDVPDIAGEIRRCKASTATASSPCWSPRPGRSRWGASATGTSSRPPCITTCR